ncbi:hypothetical protein L7F22_020427 [Adiantum nelumboides]|nr:hypothetical protein [Adiantum nelumboides]
MMADKVANMDMDLPQQRAVTKLPTKRRIQELASLFPDCDKDGQACRKKWRRVYDAYKKDKAHNSISRNDRKITCDWYDIVDEYMHSIANVVSESRTSALGSFADEEMIETVALEEASAQAEEVVSNSYPIVCSGLSAVLAKKLQA